MEAVMSPSAQGRFFGDLPEIRNAGDYVDLVEAEGVFEFFDRLFGEETFAFTYRWPRATAREGFTGAHYDVVYMGRGSLRLMTLWTPLGAIPFENGPLAMLEGSHDSPSWRRVRETYGRMDVDIHNVDLGWLSCDPAELVDTFGGRWLTTEFSEGDAIVFGMLTMHGSLNNVSDRYRLSCDTRYQPASEPKDERWVGANPIGHYAWRKTPVRPIAEARHEWGI